MRAIWKLQSAAHMQRRERLQRGGRGARTEGEASAGLQGARVGGAFPPVRPAPPLGSFGGQGALIQSNRQTQALPVSWPLRHTCPGLLGKQPPERAGPRHCGSGDSSAAGRAHWPRTLRLPFIGGRLPGRRGAAPLRVPRPGRPALARAPPTVRPVRPALGPAPTASAQIASFGNPPAPPRSPAIASTVLEWTPLGLPVSGGPSGARASCASVTVSGPPQLR